LESFWRLAALHKSVIASPRQPITAENFATLYAASDPISDEHLLQETLRRLCKWMRQSQWKTNMTME